MALLDIDPLTGAIETMVYDHQTKGLTITRTRDVSSILDANVASYNDSSKAWKSQTGDLWHVATVPEDVLWIWLQEFNSVRPDANKVKSPYLTHKEWEDHLWMLLNSSDNRKLKTAPVHV